MCKECIVANGGCLHVHTECTLYIYIHLHFMIIAIPQCSFASIHIILDNQRCSSATFVPFA